MGKKIKKLLTLEQLVTFCEQNNFHNFSAKDSGYTLSVQVPGNLNFSDKEDDDLLYTTVKVCHTLLNRNGSYISEDNMKKAMPTLKYKPLLASIIEDENGELDFNGHDMVINDDGSVDYIEKQIGTFTVDDPYLKYDEDQDKTYVMATAVIPREYTPASSIIERKNGTKVSCELRINEMQYNGKEKYLELTDFVFSGVCCLGESVGEGMLGSRLDITDFSTENNSLCYEENNKLVEVLEKLNTTLSNFQIDNNQRKEEAEVDKEIFEQVTEEVVEETAEETTEEVTEESTEEVIVTEEESEETTEETPEVVVTEEVVEVVEEVAEETAEEIEQFEQVKNLVRTFEISHEDLRYALYNLLAAFESADNEWYYITAVFDTYFTYENWNGSKIYGQAYLKDGDNVSFDGERYNLHKEYLTDAEYAELMSMRSNYASLVQFKQDTENAQLHAQREAVLYDAKYSALAEKDENNEFKNESFAKLVSEMDNYALIDLEKELKSVFADYITNGGQFAYAGETESKPVVNKKTFAASTDKKPSRYGNLFKK